MTFEELIERTAQRTGASKASTRAFARAMIAEMVASVAEGQDVPLPGLGRLSRRWRPARVLRSVATGRRRPLDGGWEVRFRSARGIRDNLRSLSPDRFKDPAHQQAWQVAEALVGDLVAYHSTEQPRLRSDSSDNEVRSSCAASLGPAWSAAVADFDRRVPAAQRDACDHLAEAARRHWAH